MRYSYHYKCNSKNKKYMKAILYWLNDECYPLLNNDGTLTLYEKLENADKMAEAMELETSRECRVISIESITE